MPDKPALPEAYLRFIDLFNRGEYFDSHEVLEDLWRRTPGEEKLFYQGLIQAAVALYHFRNRNEHGRDYEARKSVEKLRTYPRFYRGLDLESFLRDFESYLNGRSTQPPFIRFT